MDFYAVLIISQEILERKVLFELIENQLYLPALFVYQCDIAGIHTVDIGTDGHEFGMLWPMHAPPLRGAIARNGRKIGILELQAITVLPDCHNANCRDIGTYRYEFGILLPIHAQPLKGATPRVQYSETAGNKHVDGSMPKNELKTVTQAFCSYNSANFLAAITPKRPAKSLISVPYSGIRFDGKLRPIAK